MQRTQVRAAVARRKEEQKAKGKEGASSSAPKAVGNGVPKRKANGKDNRPSKKVTVTPGDKLLKKPLPPKLSLGAGKGLMKMSGLITQELDRRLLTHKDYAVEMVESIIKDKDVDPCAEEMTEELGASSFFDLARVRFFLSFFPSFFSYLLLNMANGCSTLQGLVRMKALQNRSVTQERVITRLHKHNWTLTDEQEQYKRALHTLNTEVKELREELEEEGRQKKKEQKAKASVEKELMALLGQVETNRADTVREFKASQPFIDSCAVYYGDGFEDCLKQVKSIYPHLDLSKVTMDDPLPLTLVGDTIQEETDDSTESEFVSKDDSVVLAQSTANPPVTPLVPSTEPLNIENPLAQDVQNKDDENPLDALASWFSIFFFF